MLNKLLVSNHIQVLLIKTHKGGMVKFPVLNVDLNLYVDICSLAEKAKIIIILIIA